MSETNRPPDAELRSIARHIVSQAKPSEQIEAFAGESRSTSVRAYDGDIESLKSGTVAGVSVRIVSQGRQGFASAGSLDGAIVAETLQSARDNLTFSEIDPDQAIAEPDQVAHPGLELCDEAVLSVSQQEKIDRALELERRTRQADPRITGVRVAAWSDSWSSSTLVSTAGIDIFESGGSCSMGCQPLAVDGDETQIGYGGDAARRPEDLDIDEIIAEAVADATGQLGATKPETRRTTVIFDPDVVASFLGVVASTLTGDSVLKGRSPFAERVGEQVASPLLWLGDDPTDPKTLGATNYDAEGLAARKNSLITAGTLGGFLHNCYTARRSGTASTGSAVGAGGAAPGVGLHAMVMGSAGSAAGLAAGASTRADESVLQLIASGGEGGGIGDAMLVRSVNGLHSGVNPVSGDFSVGAQGNAIVGGEIAEPFREATIAGTLQQMLLNIIALSDRPKRLAGGMEMSAMALSDITLSGS